jgi:predicted methyltransferase
MSLSRSVLVALLATSLLPILPAQTSAQTSPQTSALTAQHPTSTPYTGDLSIFEGKDRADKLHIDRVMDLLEIKPGASVADIGAGGGWFTVRAARRVGPSGKVIAEDINPKAIDAIRRRAESEHLTNIDPLLGTPDDPKLPPDSLDAALMLEVYHEIAHPQQVLAVVRAALKAGGRFGVIDRNGNGADHGLDEAVLRSEIERAGFKQVGRYDFTKAAGQDYFLIFEKTAANPAAKP